MKNLFILLAAITLLTGCPKQKEVQEMFDGLKEKKNKVEELVLQGDFSTTNLLSMHEYFFDFSEKVLLLKSEEKASESIAKKIKKTGLKEFCQDFFITTDTWKKINQYCEQGDYYACSSEMKEFPLVVEEFKNVLGADYISESNQIKECFN